MTAMTTNLSTSTAAMQRTSCKKMNEQMKEEKAKQHATDEEERKKKRRTKGLTEDQRNTRPTQLLSLHANCRNCRKKLIFIGMQTINELSSKGCYFCKSTKIYADRGWLNISRHQVLPKTLRKALEFRVTDIHL